MVTKGSVVEFAEVMNSTAGTASMVEARSAAVVAASMVEGEQVMEADTGKT
jgi:hypothetical protein